MDARYTQVKQKKKLDPGGWLYVHSTFNKQLHRCPEFEARVRAWAEVVTTKQTNKQKSKALPVRQYPEPMPATVSPWQVRRALASECSVGFCFSLLCLYFVAGSQVVCAVL